MDSSALALITALVVLLVLSAFFSASETSFAALNRIRIKSMAGNGNTRARRVLELSENYDQLLSSVLIGNNIVNITASALATVLFVGWFGNIGVTLSTIVTTVAVLIFGEISPKTLAKESPESFAMFAAPALRVLMVLLKPVNWLMSQWKALILKIFHVQNGRSATEQELLTYVEEVRQDGGINLSEEEMIRTVIEFDDLQAVDIFTPRVDVYAVDVEAPTEEIARMFHETGYSRLPVYRNSVDDILGVLLAKDFHYFVQNMGQSVESVLRPALFIMKTVKISTLLRELQQKKIHMAVVVDEYGGTMGILTIEDIVEELVGEIWDEHDEVEQDIQPRSDGSLLVAGGTDMDELFALLEKPKPETASLTVGGWAIETLGHIPKKGEAFEGEGLAVRIEEMRRNRVGSVVVERLPEPNPALEEAPPN